LVDKWRWRPSLFARFAREKWRSLFKGLSVAAVDVEPVDETLARAAGEALAAIPIATAVDAVVMASAARRGDVVYTSDFDELTRLQRDFRAVRVLAV